MVELTPNIAKKEGKESNFLLLLYACLYINISIMTLVFVYKYVKIGSLTIGVPALMMPFWYTIGDAVAELFGYKVAKKFIILNVINCLLFALVANTAIYLPSPATWHEQHAYDYIFGSVFRVSIGGEISIIVGGLVNAYFISKWKVLCKGRYFWLRSLTSSLIGVVCQILIAVIIIYYGKVEFIKLVHLFFWSVLTHICICSVIVWPNTLIVTILKRYLPDIYDTGISWNPFATTSVQKQQG